MHGDVTLVMAVVDCMANCVSVYHVIAANRAPMQAISVNFFRFAFYLNRLFTTLLVIVIRDSALRHKTSAFIDRRG
jgi:hypothetical protein